MPLAAFKDSLTADGPPPGTSPPVRALWWAAKGDWSRAHEVAQEHDALACAWVHGYLHRAEGDHGNAAYWYRRGGRTPGAAPPAPARGAHACPPSPRRPPPHRP